MDTRSDADRFPYEVYERKPGFWESLFRSLRNRKVYDLVILTSVVALAYIAGEMAKQGLQVGAIVVAAMIACLGAAALWIVWKRDAENQETRGDESSQSGDDQSDPRPP